MMENILLYAPAGKCYRPFMAHPDLSPAQKKALQVLENKENPTRKELEKLSKIDDTGLRGLVDAGWVAEVAATGKGKVPRFTLTEAGRRAAKSPPDKVAILSDEDRPRHGGGAEAGTGGFISGGETKPRGGSPEAPGGPTMADLFREIAATRQEIAELRTMVAALGTPTNPARPAVSSGNGSAPSSYLDPSLFRKALRGIVAEIDRRDHHDGLVPIGKVRDGLAYLGLDRVAFDAALLEQERAFVVDLKIANNPARVKDPQSGISIEGRGLLYFVVLR